MNFFRNEISLYNKENYFDKIKIILLSFIPLFLILGTAISEIAIIILFFIFLYEFFLKKKRIFQGSLFIAFVLIYSSLIINQIFSFNFNNSLIRNVLFIKYIVLVLGIVNFIPEKNYRIHLILKFWLSITMIFALDMYVQFIFGKNLIGMESPLKYHRVSGFMGDELKAGSLLLATSFIVSTFLISEAKYNKTGLIFLIFFLSTIFISGDRSNFIKSILIFSFLLFFFNSYNLKNILILFLPLVVFLSLILSNHPVMKDRYVNKVFGELSSNNFNVIKYINSTEYGKLYYTGYILFKSNKLTGVGNKNFRMLCDEKNKEKLLDKKYLHENNFRCNTHPHQVYFELLAEHGLIGSATFIILLLIFLKKNILDLIRKKNLLLTSIFLSIIINFTPFLPGGSFFTSFNATLFWINISLFFSYKKMIKK